MTKVLITGFDPFGGEAINPAFEAVKKIPETIAGATIVKVEVPTVFGAAIDTVVAAMTEHNPDIVICVGQAGGRFEMTPERVAINVDDARIADNKGNQPLNVPVYADGAAAYFSNLPVKAMVEAMKAAGVPAALSNTAGTFVCNHIMYGVLYHINTNPAFAHMKGGFIHVPFLPEQVLTKPNTPSLSLEQMATALTAAVEAAVENTEDINVVAGQTH
ncbi:pyroglutamyl-peptidase I [Culicoidibacter larvae]|uniref:Pyrrolidone-carboxylate peptidase n=1 Tax=Culicoidibacter larvae TaxID=2579976 RepID=A0A5R8QH90_9FIRM|nr:pyroglutamyl-peptidase I [Culicoidibacter larvae]TLG77411.1 pyroglutamyl-peptidase I [Culicoidibacter larvae]